MVGLVVLPQQAVRLVPVQLAQAQHSDSVLLAELVVVLAQALMLPWVLLLVQRLVVLLPV